MFFSFIRGDCFVGIWFSVRHLVGIYIEYIHTIVYTFIPFVLS